MQSQVTKQLAKHIREAVAMEQSVLRMLNSTAKTTPDEELSRAAEEHARTTRQHVDRLQQRLKAHGSSPSPAKQVGGAVASRAKTAVDLARRDKAGRNARDAFASEHLEVASYELLERIARRAGDEETAQVARQNRREDEAMAQRIAQEWDRVVDLSLASGGRTGSSGKVRQAASKASSLVKNPLLIGPAAVAGGLLLGRRAQSGGGDGASSANQPQELPLEQLTKQELQQRAAAAGIDVRREMKKHDLVEALRSRT